MYLLAKKHGVGCPEQFAKLLTQHFLEKYSWVVKAKVHVLAYPWRRINGQQGGRPQEHYHAFVYVPEYERFATVNIAQTKP